MTRLIFAVLVLLADCSAAPPRRAAGESAPLASHHQHLLSPAVAKLWSDPQLPTIAPPPALADVLQRREAAFGDAKALAALYAGDAIYVGSLDTQWLRGPDAIARHLAGRFRGPYRIAPVDAVVDGANARIAAYFVRDGKPFTHASFALVRSADAQWRIASEALVFEPTRAFEPFDADALVAQLDAAGMRRALVLSVAYTYGDPRRTVDDEYAKVRAENDWTVAQAARHPDRLVAFCGVSPLRDYALAEIERCARDRGVTGLKLHLGNSGVDLRDPAHVARLRAVFGAANARRLAVVVHMMTRRADYGRDDAKIFLDEVLAAAPDVPVQIAHFAGSGPGYPTSAGEALSVFVDAVKAGDPRIRRTYFDLTTVVTLDTDAATAERVARRIRELGTRRVVFGADLAIGGNPPPQQAWAAFRMTTPLSQEEFRAVARNVAPFLR